MENISDDVLNTLLGLAQPAIAVLAGWMASKWNTRQDREREMHLTQLNEVYEPLIALLIRKELYEQENPCSLIDELIIGHNALAAPKVIEAWLQYKKEKNEVTWAIFRDVVESNYNWVKCKLGYPFQNDKIRDEYHPNGYITPVQYLVIALIYLIMGLLMFAIAAFTSSDSSDLSLYVNVTGVVLCLMFALLFLGKSIIGAIKEVLMKQKKKPAAGEISSKNKKNFQKKSDEVRKKRAKRH